MFTTGYTTGAAWNETQFSDKEFEKILFEARAEPDEDKRRSMYREMQIILRDRGGTIVPAFANDLVARTHKIAHGEHVSPLKAFDGRRIIERWWVA
jgi:peptide/nickel transport system substrate-binding protein